MLTDVQIRNAKPKDRPYKLPDGEGLHLLVDPKGGRWWRFRYRFEGLEKMLSFGTYPEVPAKLARERRYEARQLIAAGTDPSAKRKAIKAARADTLELLAEEWFGQLSGSLTEGTIKRDRDRFARLLLPKLGSRSIRNITAVDLLACLRLIEVRGKRETARRTKGIFSRIARYAIATGRGDRDVSADLRGALIPPVKKNYATITDPTKVGELLQAIEDYDGWPVVQYALRLAPLVFVRPGELRGARWKEFDLEGKEPIWRIPSERMKMGEEHLVPLSTQATAIVKQLQNFTGNGEFVFPSVRSRTRPMSDNTVNAALRRLGYGTDEMTGHGFRHMASTLLNERGYPPDVIELQLSHAERNKVRGTYNKAKRLVERRKMMQEWAAYLDELRQACERVSERKAA